MVKQTQSIMCPKCLNVSFKLVDETTTHHQCLQCGFVFQHYVEQPGLEFIPRTKIELDWGDRFETACPMECPSCLHYPIQGVYDWEMYGTVCDKCGFYLEGDSNYQGE